MLNKQNIFKVLKWILAAVFIILIGIEIFHIIEHKHSISSQRRMLLLISLTLITLHKNKYTWLAGVILFSYALYYLAVVAGKYSDFTTLEFTAGFYILFKDVMGMSWRIFVKAFPFYFYFISFVIFLTPMGRRWYGISFRKQPKISSLN